MSIHPAKNIALFLSSIAFSLILSMPAYCWDHDDNIEKAVRDFKGSLFP